MGSASSRSETSEVTAGVDVSVVEDKKSSKSKKADDDDGIIDAIQDRLEDAGEVLDDVKDAAVADAKVVVSDVLKGDDALGSIVKVASAHNKQVDHALHLCNNVGFKFVDAHRKLFMLGLCVPLGMAAFSCSVCGALGVGSGTMKVLPWYEWMNAPVTPVSAAVWACGPCSPCTLNNLSCASSFFLSAAWKNNTPFPRSDPSFDGNYTITKSSTQNPIGLPKEYTQNATAYINWRFNAWGVCWYPTADEDEWLVKALIKNGDGVVSKGDGGACRDWDQFADGKGTSKDWSDNYGQTMKKCGGQLAGDFVTIVMGTFGAFMKIVEPFSRLTREKDFHQKTITIMITIVSVLMPVILIATFTTRCVSNLDHDIAEFSDLYAYNGITDSGYQQTGVGFQLFTWSIVMMLLAALVHTILPSGNARMLFEDQDKELIKGPKSDKGKSDQNV